MFTMSASAIPSKSGSSFLWVLAAFASFAMLFLIIQTLAAKPGAEDPRAPERIANTAEIIKAQSEIIAKMGMNDATRKSAIFDKALTVLSSRKPTTSAQLVPGSPTQIKQAAETAAPVAAPANSTPAIK